MLHSASLCSYSQIESCLPGHEPPLAGYDALLDGQVLHKIWLQIDPEPQHHPVRLENVDDLYLPNARAKNFDSIIKNLKILFEEELDQTVLVLPDCAILGHSPGKWISWHKSKPISQVV